jgi:two-component system chemotaxis response regulator CheB
MNVRNKKKVQHYDAVVIGASAGGVEALSKLVPVLSRDLRLPVIIVQHISPNSDSFLTKYLDGISGVRVKEVEEKEIILGGTVYFAPPNYHLMVEEDKTLSLSVEEKVNYSRPSIDVMFETAAMAYGRRLIGIVLTGANHDGAAGLKMIKDFGGMTIVQNPVTAYVDAMPLAALEICNVDHVMELEEIAPYLNALSNASKVDGQENND